MFESGKIYLNVLGNLSSTAGTAQKITLLFCICREELDAVYHIEFPAKREIVLKYLHKFA
jgi:hypothetical protein